MALQERDNDALQRYTSRVIDYLANVSSPRKVRDQLQEVLLGLARRVGIPEVFYFRISTGKTQPRRISLLSSSARTRLDLRKSMADVPLTILSSQVIKSLDSQQPLHLEKGQFGGSRLLLTLLSETQLNGLLLIPIDRGKKLRGLIVLAHSEGSQHIDSRGCQQIRIIGQLLAEKMRSARRMAIQKRQHREWRRIADASCDFAAVTGHDFRVRKVLSFGATAPEIVGTSLSAILPEQTMAKLNQSVQLAMTEDRPASCDVLIGWELGARSWYRVRVQSNSATETFTFYFTDIDVDRTQQEKLNELQAHVNRVARLTLLGQINTEFAHQINQPLQSIMFQCGIVQMRLKGSKLSRRSVSGTMQKILDAVEHASGILVRIREFVQFRSLRIEDHDMIEICERAVQMVESKAMNRNVHLRCSWRLDTGRWGQSHDQQLWIARVDEIQTTQILINLLVNAIEACEEQTSPAPEILVSAACSQDQRFIEVCIQDNGPGLPKENPGKVFDRFHTTKQEGLGIGLAISRSVAESQNGALRALNNAERGCTFCLSVRRSSLAGSKTDEIKTIPADNLPAD
ncbi:MAG: GHKL domain-containing protein [Planctomycetaceae bacterium]|nr:GHKL domain-containing protein [Planctomycetaceae bacterium]